MHPVELFACLGVVGALVGAAALLAREAGRGDQPRQRVRVLAQLGEPLGVAAKPGNRSFFS